LFVDMTVENTDTAPIDLDFQQFFDAECCQIHRLVFCLY